ncbi:PepSY domain-containing protein [bacterium]|nr:MAG: PepSY domain-containing protein [bacterium]
MHSKQPRPYVRSLRQTRPWHRYVGISLFLFILISSITGILLSWKKQSDWLQPNDKHHIEQNDSKNWLSLDELKSIAERTLAEEGINQPIIDRMDVRPKKGMVKVLFKNDDWEVQLELSTGKVLSVSQRNADWIERLHDGSIISEGFKLFSMNLLGIGLLILSFTGLWLWFGPKLVKKSH